MESVFIQLMTQEIDSRFIEFTLCAIQRKVIGSQYCQDFANGFPQLLQATRKKQYIVDVHDFVFHVLQYSRHLSLEDFGGAQFTPNINLVNRYIPK